MPAKILNGRIVAQKVKERSKTILAIIHIEISPPPSPTHTFIDIKVRNGHNYGVEVQVIRLDQTITTDEVIAKIKALNRNPAITGIVVQLPLPKHLNQNKIIRAIARKKDVDGLNRDSYFESPMVLALIDFIKLNKIKLAGRNILVIGRGPLVGLPVARWLRKHGYKFKVIDIKTRNPNKHIQEADIIIAGSGKNIIGFHNTHNGQVILNGSGEDVNEKDSQRRNIIYTPNKGGFGPAVVAHVLNNTKLAKALQMITEYYPKLNISIPPFKS